MLILVISDTHGYLDTRVWTGLAGLRMIIHAGDVGSHEVIRHLGEVAPVHAVQGNNDAKIGGLGLPEHLDLEVEDVKIHVVHQLADARPLPGTRVVISGHSHKALIDDRDGILYLNPGAAGRTGFHHIQTIALLEIAQGHISAEILELGPRLLAASAPARPAAGGNS